MKEGSKIVFYTPQEEAELKTIYMNPDKKEKKRLFAAFASNSGRNLPTVKQKAAVLCKTNKGTKKTITKTPTTTTPVRVSRSEINIPLTSVSVYQDETQKWWLKATI